MPVKCEICNRKLAKYVCIECGARVCEDCYDRESLMCIRCQPPKKERTLLNSYYIRSGLFLIMIGAIILSLGGLEGGSFIYIFPFFLISTSDWRIALVGIFLFIFMMVLILIYIGRLIRETPQ